MAGSEVEIDFAAGADLPLGSGRPATPGSPGLPLAPLAPVYSFSILHREPSANFPLPSVFAIVDIDEGYSMFSSIVDCDPIDHKSCSLTPALAAGPPGLRSLVVPEARLEGHLHVVPR